MDCLYYVDINVQRINFEGEDIGFESEWSYGYNILWGLDIEYIQGSSIKVTESVFENIDWIGIFIGSLLDTTVTIGGRPHDKNTFTKMGYNGVWIQDISNYNIEISFCEIFETSGVYIRNFGIYLPEIQPSNYYIHHNTIRQRENTDWASVELWDTWNSWYGVSTIKVVIDKNKIYSESHIAPFGPIFGFSIDNAKKKSCTVQ